MAAAAKQQHQYNDNQDQFHGKSPLTVLRLFTAHHIRSPPITFCICRLVLSASSSVSSFLSPKTFPAVFFHELGLFRRPFDPIFIY
jgi:hypothetical protein